MERQNYEKNHPYFIGIGVLGLTSLGGTKINSIIETKAGYSKASLPVTIDLNRTSQIDVRNYYSALNTLAASERTGTNLLKNLKPILSNGQKYYSYDISSGADIWKMYEITDRDWVKSPASEISGYDAATNTINNYKYRKTGVDPYIHALYVNRDVDNKMTAWSNHNQTEWGINREHIWPKSHGFDDDNNATSGARGDPMHLWAGDGYVNRIHSNNFYGYVDKTKSYDDLGDAKGFEYTKGNLSGKSKTVGGSYTVFEPQDCDKGDIARSVFYMVARYNNIAGDDSTIGVDNPNLTLSNTINMKNGTSTATNAYSLGILSDLLEWNKIDPVDEYEINRNDLLYKNFTNNRNPFIDFPSWADCIWGDVAWSKSASPTTDRINGSAIKVEVPSQLEIGKEYTLKAEGIDPGTEVTWEIEDDTIATISKKTSEPTSGAHLITRAKASIKLNAEDEVTLKILKAGEIKLTIKGKVDGVEETQKLTLNATENKPEEKSWFDILSKLDLKLIILIGAGALIVIVVVAVLFFKFASKKTKKKAKKVVKKGIKKAANGSKGKKK